MSEILGIIAVVLFFAMLYNAYLLGRNSFSLDMIHRVFRPWLDRRDEALRAALGSGDYGELIEVSANYTEAWEAFVAVPSIPSWRRKTGITPTPTAPARTGEEG